jgi:hypothetical protein
MIDRMKTGLIKIIDAFAMAVLTLAALADTMLILFGLV